jgi:ankyrin repeat protein
MDNEWRSRQLQWLAWLLAQLTLVNVAVAQENFEELVNLKNWESITNMIIEDRGAAFWTSSEGYSLLQYAIEFDQEALAERLIAKGAFLNLDDRHPASEVLYFAIKREQTHIVGLLLSQAKEEEVISKAYLAHLLEEASVANQLDIVKLLIDFGADTRSIDDRNRLFDILRNRNSDMARLLIDAGADIKVRHDDGYTLLHFAVFNDSLELISYLEQHGLDVNAKSGDGTTPLILGIIFASTTDKQNFVYRNLDYLINRGADTCIGDYRGELTNGVTLVEFVESTGDVEDRKYLGNILCPNVQ